jgi:hypothetical protein
MLPKSNVCDSAFLQFYSSRKRKKTFVGNRAAGKKPLPSIFFGQDEM